MCCKVLSFSYPPKQTEEYKTLLWCMESISESDTKNENVLPEKLWPIINLIGKSTIWLESVHNAKQQYIGNTLFLEKKPPTMEGTIVQQLSTNHPRPLQLSKFLSIKQLNSSPRRAHTARWASTQQAISNRTANN
jgi:hypothetical protein